MLAICVGGLLYLMSVLLPERSGDHLAMVEWVLVIVVPAMLYILAAKALWRQNRAIAIGILLAGITVLAHVVVHVASRGGTA